MRQSGFAVNIATLPDLLKSKALKKEAKSSQQSVSANLNVNEKRR
jgi:hypothetical protein